MARKKYGYRVQRSDGTSYTGVTDDSKAKLQSWARAYNKHNKDKVKIVGHWKREAPKKRTTKKKSKEFSLW